MINLGFDILLSTFDLLAQEDKLECMTVCQQWYDIIYTHSLFRDIYIYNQKQLDLLIARVEKDPAVGEKVETLVVEMLCDLAFDRNRFPELFPNLRYHALQDMEPHFYVGVSVKPHQNHPWCRYMKRIEEKEPTVKMLLVSGFCKNLTFISVERKKANSEHDFIKSLTNAPALKVLDMKNIILSLQDLELLHEMVPLLEALWLKSCSLYYTHSPHGIIPATSVKSLQCVDFNNHDTKAFFLYTTQKYTHVEHLKLYQSDWDDTLSDTEQQTMAIAPYMKSLGPRLKSFSVIFGWEELELFDAFDFDIMDTGGFHIEKLELGDNVGLPRLERLAETTQAQYVRSLTISGMDYVQVVESDPSLFSWLLRFKSLKELELRALCDSNSIVTFRLNLTDLLENLCETRLERLRLHDVHLQLDESSKIPVYSSLKSLTLAFVTFDSGIDTFISGAFPNLIRLALEFPRGLQESIMFPNLDLSYLEMINSTKAETFPVMVITLDDGQQRLYNARTKDRMSRYDRSNPLDNQLHIPSAYCQSFDKSDITPMLTITCHSVYDFNLFVCKSYYCDIRRMIL